MEFPFVMRKLKKHLENEKGLAFRHDRFAPGRVKEIEKVIEILTSYKEPGETIVKQLPIVKRTKVALTELIKHFSPFK